MSYNFVEKFQSWGFKEIFKTDFREPISDYLCYTRIHSHLPLSLSLFVPLPRAHPTPLCCTFVRAPLSVTWHESPKSIQNQISFSMVASDPRLSSCLLARWCWVSHRLKNDDGSVVPSDRAEKTKSLLYMRSFPTKANENYVSGTEVIWPTSTFGRDWQIHSIK